MLPDLARLPRTGLALRGALPSALLAVWLACGCAAPLPYVARDAGLAEARAAFSARRLDDAALAAFLAAGGHPAPAAGQPWDFESLALVAGWYSADVAVAQARWQAASAQAQLGPAAVAPALDTLVEHHSVSDASRPQPWTLGLGFEFTLPSRQRQAARQAQLDSAVLLARIALAQAFWDARRQVRVAWLQLTSLAAAQPLAAEQARLAAEREQRTRSRVAGGEAAEAELVTAGQASLRAQAALQQLAEEHRAAQAALRVAVGLPAAGQDLPLALAEAAADELPTAVQAALDNRLDLRAAEARFELADADLRWAVARQYPDLTLKPGYEWDQGDHRLRVGLSLPLPLPAAHAAEVNQAQAEREARALELQGRQEAVLQELAQARLALDDARVRRAAQDLQVNLARRQLAVAEAMHRHGEADALAVVDASAALVTQQQAQAEVAQVVLRRRAELEDALQLPLEALSVPAAAAAGARPATLGSGDHGT